MSCSCRKIGLRCSAVCEHCRGQSCLNVETDVIESNMDDYDNVDPMTFLMQETKETIAEEYIEEIIEKDKEASKETDVEEENE